MRVRLGGWMGRGLSLPCLGVFLGCLPLFGCLLVVWLKRVENFVVSHKGAGWQVSVKP